MGAIKIEFSDSHGINSQQNEYAKNTASTSVSTDIINTTLSQSSFQSLFSVSVFLLFFFYSILKHFEKSCVYNLKVDHIYK